MAEAVCKVNGLIITPGYCNFQGILEWLERLREDDRDNVNRLVKGLFDWTKEVGRRNGGARTSLSAVGSTLEPERKDSYRDIDFLMLSNLPLSKILPKESRGNMSHLNKILYDGPESHCAHFVDISDEFYRSLYHREDIPEQFMKERGLISVITPGRLKTESVPDPSSPEKVRFRALKGHWSKAHVIVQGGVESVREWNRFDKFARLPIYSLGNHNP